MDQMLPEPECRCVENGNPVTEVAGVVHEQDCKWFGWFATFGKSYSWSVSLD